MLAISNIPWDASASLAISRNEARPHVGTLRDCCRILSGLAIVETPHAFIDCDTLIMLESRLIGPVVKGTDLYRLGLAYLDDRDCCPSRSGRRTVGKGERRPAGGMRQHDGSRFPTKARSST